MRGRIALVGFLGIAVVSCTNPPPASAPPSSSSTVQRSSSTTSDTSAVRSSEGTSTVVLTTTAGTLAPKPRLTITYEPGASYADGAFTHVELFRYFPDLPDAFPLLVTSVDQLAPTESAVLLDGEREPGVYELRSYQRPCIGTCDVLESPSDGCVVRLDLEPGATIRATLRVEPGASCEFDIPADVETGAPDLGMSLTLRPIGSPACEPTSPFDEWPEVLATSHGKAVGWGLLWARPPLTPGREVKMVFRLTGAGRFTVDAIHTDGTIIDPSWGPNDHGTHSSSYGRAGNEWGMAFTFPKSGCWNLHFTRGDEAVDVWLQVGG